MLDFLLVSGADGVELSVAPALGVGLALSFSTAAWISFLEGRFMLPEYSIWAPKPLFQFKFAG
jgi:hypothetical protein